MVVAVGVHRLRRRPFGRAAELTWAQAAVVATVAAGVSAVGQVAAVALAVASRASA